MTAAILTRRTNDPTTCFVCQGVAMSIGVSSRNGKGYAVPPFNNWTCHDCTRHAQRIVNMKSNDIGAIEMRSLDAVAKSTLDEGISTFLGALFDAGVRDLESATEEQIDMAKEALVVGGAAHHFAKSIVLGFGDEVKAAVERGDAPF